MVEASVVRVIVICHKLRRWPGINWKFNNEPWLGLALSVILINECNEDIVDYWVIECMP